MAKSKAHKKPEDYEWPYLISLTKEEYDQKVYPLMKGRPEAYGVPGFKEAKGNGLLDAMGIELEAIPNKFYFTGIAIVSFQAVRLDDETLIAETARERQLYEHRYAGLSAMYDAHVCEDLHWFDAMLLRERMYLAYDILGLEAKRRGIKECDLEDAFKKLVPLDVEEMIVSGV
jgi:hypothetical protein